MVSTRSPRLTAANVNTFIETLQIGAEASDLSEPHKTALLKSTALELQPTVPSSDAQQHEVILAGRLPETVVELKEKATAILANALEATQSSLSGTVALEMKKVVDSAVQLTEHSVSQNRRSR